MTTIASVVEDGQDVTVEVNRFTWLGFRTLQLGQSLFWADAKRYGYVSEKRTFSEDDFFLGWSFVYDPISLGACFFIIL